VLQYFIVVWDERSDLAGLRASTKDVDRLNVLAQSC
jgi:hypothetical protein